MVRLSRKKIYWIAIVFLLLVVFLGILWVILAQPTWVTNNPSSISVNKDRLKEHVRFLSIDAFPRHDMTPLQLEKAASYIEKYWGEIGYRVERQEVPRNNKKYFNIIGHLNEGKGHKMVIGAHYDGCLQTPGADDNASGVAGLMELSVLLANANLSYEIEVVAYALEEHGLIGSMTHAKSLSDKKEQLDGVLVFEMIGYFSDEPYSQKFPLPLLYLYYPNQGNFIALVGVIGQRPFTKLVKQGMQGSTNLPIYSLNAPTSLKDINRSDHAAYWQFGFPAIMITDTANFRNSAYHTSNDTIDRLDFDRMAQVVISVYNFLVTRKIN